MKYTFKRILARHFLFLVNGILICITPLFLSHGMSLIKEVTVFHYSYVSSKELYETQRTVPVASMAPGIFPNRSSIDMNFMSDINDSSYEIEEHKLIVLSSPTALALLGLGSSLRM